LKQKLTLPPAGNGTSVNQYGSENPAVGQDAGVPAADEDVHIPVGEEDDDHKGGLGLQKNPGNTYLSSDLPCFAVIYQNHHVFFSGIGMIFFLSLIICFSICL
jgi:hypothetical protein